MENIKILKNIPLDVLTKFTTIYNSKFKGRKPQDKWTDSHAASALEVEDIKMLNNFLPIPARGIEIYYMTGMVNPHIDRGRKTALQIPIEIDHKKSFIFSVCNNDLSKLSPVNVDFTPRKVSKNSDIVNNPPNWFYKWEEPFFDKYSLEFPVLQNVSLPHGGANYSERYGIFFSLAYKTDYEEVCSKFRSWV